MAFGTADQNLQRRYRKFKDQHGRQWGAITEIKTGHPCSVIEAKFSAPFYPPAKYLRFDEENNALVIEYAAWVSDLQAAKRAYFEKGKKFGFEKYGALFDPNKPFTEEVLLYLGPAPLPAEPVQAAQQGNRWALGLLGPNGETPKMPEKLAPFFVKPEPVVETFADEYEDTYEPAPKREPVRRRAAVAEEE